MTCQLPHVQRDDRPHFITFVTFQRWTLPPEARSIVLESCTHDHLRTMELHAAVVMPDHVHLILTPAVNQDRGSVYRLDRILWAIKSASAHRVNKLLGRSGKVWQEEYLDHVIRNSDSLLEKIEYVVENPVRAGLVQNAAEYPWMWIGPRAKAPAVVELLQG